MPHRVFSIIVLLALTAPRAFGDTGTISLTPVITGLDHPVALTASGDDRLYVVEQSGRVLMVRPGEQPRTFLDLKDRVVSGGEMGLLSLAMHPRFAENRRCFVNYTMRDGRQLLTIVAEYRANADATAADGERIIMRIEQPYANHNGGQLAFGPDGYLYIGMGDGGAGGDPHGHGQNTRTLLGALLRIDVNGEAPYAVPADNPLVGREGADELWAWGLRNPWRFSFDRATGRLFAGDVGQNRYEEIDLIERGRNYGWNFMEGAHCYPPKRTECRRPDLVLPIAEYGRDEGISVTGGYVYRGSRVPAIQGAYVFGDFGSAKIWMLREGKAGAWDREVLTTSPEAISSFGEDAQGELYVVGYEGTIFRVDPPETQAGEETR